MGKAGAIYEEISFQQKCVAEPRRLAVVVHDRFVQLQLRDIEKPDGHFTRYFASTS